jgi:hypothetical protein
MEYFATIGGKWKGRDSPQFNDALLLYKQWSDALDKIEFTSINDADAELVKWCVDFQSGVYPDDIKKRIDALRDTIDGVVAKHKDEEHKDEIATRKKRYYEEHKDETAAKRLRTVCHMH